MEREREEGGEGDVEGVCGRGNGVGTGRGATNSLEYNPAWALVNETLERSSRLKPTPTVCLFLHLPTPSMHPCPSYTSPHIPPPTISFPLLSPIHTP